MANLDRASLLQHISSHKRMAGICPICVTYPHGDPNYVSRDLHGHMIMRHQFEMGEVIENDTSEEAMI
jgi:hypothetical protein